MTAYISGRITGDPDYKRKFAAHAEELTQAGYKVMSPAALPEGLHPAEYMRIDLAMIDAADVVVFLPDWEESMGAILEHDYCAYTGKAMMEVLA